MLRQQKLPPIQLSERRKDHKAAAGPTCGAGRVQTVGTGEGRSWGWVIQARARALRAGGGWLYSRLGRILSGA